jgi:L-alanine-DL-glutamate epimerase-like enolase superfamily enzyme
MPDAIRLSTLIEELEPYFAEDLIRSENPAVYRTLRPKVKVPIAVGEQFGDRWDIHELVERQLIDYSRVSIPNSGGITEFMKIAALCETHCCWTDSSLWASISGSAGQACGVFPGPVLMEMTAPAPREEPPPASTFLIPSRQTLAKQSSWIRCRV